MSTVSVYEIDSICSTLKVSMGTAESTAERGLPRRPVITTSSSVSMEEGMDKFTMKALKMNDDDDDDEDEEDDDE